MLILQCYVNVNYDPHAGRAIVTLGKASPVVELQGDGGDSKAITVHCDAPLEAEERPLGQPIPTKR